jgi:protein tyrosine phosphatase (PTP) superfamily phosphohydrolase (DUF442 family)
MNSIRRFTFRSLLYLALFSISFALGASAFAKIDKLLPVDTGLFRGSQPTSQADYDQLKQLGVKTILNLRWDKSVAASKAAAEANGFGFVNIPIVAADGPTDAQVAQALSVLRDPTLRPTFFHCTLGRDRTGLIAALYKIKYEGMSPVDAYREWTGLGFSNKFLVKLDRYFKGATGINQPKAAAPRCADVI